MNIIHEYSLSIFFTLIDGITISKHGPVFILENEGVYLKFTSVLI